MKRIVPLLVAVFVALGSTAVAQDGDATEALKELEPKDLYKQECKACHGPDSEWGEYSPMDLIQEQWEEFFDEDLVETHGELQTASEDDGDTKLLDLLDEDLLKILRDFCVDHAADSEQPMTCG